MAKTAQDFSDLFAGISAAAGGRFPEHRANLERRRMNQAALEKDEADREAQRAEARDKIAMKFFDLAAQGKFDSKNAPPQIKEAWHQIGLTDPETGELPEFNQEDAKPGTPEGKMLESITKMTKRLEGLDSSSQEAKTVNLALTGLRRRLSQSGVEKKNLEFRDLGNEVVALDRDGNIVKRMPKGLAPSRGRAPSTTVNNYRLPDNTIRSVRAGSPEEDAILAAGGIASSKGGGVSIQRDSDGSFSVQVGGDRSTIGTKGKFEQEINKIDELILQMGRLDQELRPEDLGVMGVLGENIFDNILAQFDGSYADPERIKNRGLVRALRESSLRTISGDSKFNQADRDAIELVLPRDGVFESLPAAKAKLAALQLILSDRAKLRAGVIDRDPISAMTPEQIREAVREGTMDKTIAVRALKYLHGSLSNGN